MPKFSFRAIDAGTRTPRQGTIDAPDAQAASKYLVDQGAEVIGIAEIKEQKTFDDFLAMRKPVPLKSMVFFTRQLATLVGSGMPLLISISSLAESEENAKLRGALEGVAQQIESGVTLPEAMQDYPDVFDKRFVSMVEAGDQSSELTQALKELAVDLEKRQKLANAIKSAAKYPKILITFVFLIVSGMLIFIIPQFADIFEQAVSGAPPDPETGEVADASLPGITQFVVKLSTTLYPAGEKNAMWILEVIGRFVVVYIIYRVIKLVVSKILKKPGPRMRWDQFKLDAPMKFGQLNQKIAIARFSRSFASLTNSGMTTVQALPIVADTTGNAVVSKAIYESQDAVLAGRPLYQPLERSGIFPTNIIQMIKSGEDSGELPAMLEKVAEFYEEEVDLQIKGLTSMIEPVMIVIIGGIVGVMAVAMFMPMVSIYDKVS